MRRRLTAEEIKQRRRRFSTWALTIVLGILLINAMVGENGYLATIRAEREEQALAAEVAKIRRDSERLKHERERLQNDPAAVEEAARELGLIRDGETLVTIRRADAPGSKPAPATPAR